MKKTRLLALIITIAMIVGLPITVISSDMGLAEDNHLCNGTHTVDESGFAVNVDGNVTYGYYSDDNIAIEIEVERFAEKYSSQIERYENTDIQGEVNVNIEYYDSEIAESNILDSYPSEVYEIIDLMRDSEISSVSKSSRIGVNSTAAGNCNPCVSSGTKIATSTIRNCEIRT